MLEQHASVGVPVPLLPPPRTTKLAGVAAARRARESVEKRAMRENMVALLGEDAVAGLLRMVSYTVGFLYLQS